MYKEVDLLERQWLKNARATVSMTQEEVAIKTEIASSTYAMYEQGRRTPSVKVARKIGNLLGFDWKDFFEPNVHELCNKRVI